MEKLNKTSRKKVFNDSLRTHMEKFLFAKLSLNCARKYWLQTLADFFACFS